MWNVKGHDAGALRPRGARLIILIVLVLAVVATVTGWGGGADSGAAGISTGFLTLVAAPVLQALVQRGMGPEPRKP